MAKSSIMIDLDDPRTAKIAEAISNKSAKNILNILGEQELTETEIAEKLSQPLNTIDYNIKKLESAGLIEKAKTFSWSPKGKAVYRYKLSNKKIIISPKSLTKGFLPALFVIILFSLSIKFFIESRAPIIEERVAANIAESYIDASKVAAPQASPIIADLATRIAAIQPWIWFLFGGLIAIIIFLIWNSSRKTDPL